MNKKITALFLSVTLLLSLGLALFAGNDSPIDALPFGNDSVPVSGVIDHEARAVFLMEAGSGRVLYEFNSDEAMLPASVTKVMTLLLVMEAIEREEFALMDMVQVSAFAAGMGGSQVYLEPGEQISVIELLKSVVIASANDAAVALAELVSGSYEAFVGKMNDRAAELGMTNTSFVNSTGLEGEGNANNMTTARDIAIMSAELIRFEKITELATIWMDSIRNGEFGLTNTNRLVRFYNGINGLKTGFTTRAMYCISATAVRDGMQLIAVVMGSPTRDSRNDTARKLLDYGFANYSFANFSADSMDPVPVRGGVENSVAINRESFGIVLNRGDNARVQEEIILPEYLPAPVATGDVVGRIVYSLNGEEIGESNIVAAECVERIGLFRLFGRAIQNFFIL
ncbi:MAG: D-alanyl-D-alanine carboxypeptidase [Oscillospiraceae bacterium]|nr:D-alanyl-D-alanine carboxypeptidase [Oscillospiraceae bacterium]